MQAWILVFLIVTAILFATKILYVIAAGWMLPITRGALVVSTGPVRIRAFLDAVPMSPREVIVDLGYVVAIGVSFVQHEGVMERGPLDLK